MSHTLNEGEMQKYKNREMQIEWKLLESKVDHRVKLQVQRFQLSTFCSYTLNYLLQKYFQIILQLSEVALALVNFTFRKRSF